MFQLEKINMVRKMKIKYYLLFKTKEKLIWIYRYSKNIFYVFKEV